METLTMMCSMLGFFAFLSVFSLSSRIQKLERELRSGSNSNGEGVVERQNLGEHIQEYIGKNVKLDFYDDEEDMDVFQSESTGTVTIADCDDRWVLVHLENRKKTQDKLLRIDSIKSIGVME